MSRRFGADVELKGWSLLGWPGYYNYIGMTTVIDPDCSWLPNSLTQVDEWISAPQNVSLS
jgi:hypothetical protein